WNASALLRAFRYYRIPVAYPGRSWPAFFKELLQKSLIPALGHEPPELNLADITGFTLSNQQVSLIIHGNLPHIADLMHVRLVENPCAITRMGIKIPCQKQVDVARRVHMPDLVAA